ncbi:aminotransferase class V-fold PLP-dependent enzyme [Micromonospora sp. NPDC003776]
MTNSVHESLAGVRADFPILSTMMNGRPLVYLDNAATTQKPRAVLDAIVDYYETANSNIGRGFYELSRSATDRYEQARATAAAFLNAAEPDEIVFTRGVTDAVNLVADTFAARILGPGDQVVVTGMEHNSNLLPWHRLCQRLGARLVVAGTTADGRPDLAAFAAAVARPSVRMAAIAHVSNVLGAVNPVADMVAAAHAHGVPVLVDGAQAVAHRPVDVRALDVDFYCFSGHKVYGPNGVGVLYGRRSLLAGLPPYQVGGGTVKGVRLDEPVSYVPVPARLEAGTPDVAGAVGLAAALDYLTAVGRETARRHDGDLTEYALRTLPTVAGVRVAGDPGADRAGIVSLVIDGIHPYDVGGHLDRHGVAVRSGVHCASTFLDSLGLLGTVRLSFGVYTTTSDIDVVRDALRTVRPGDWTANHPTTRFL